MTRTHRTHKGITTSHYNVSELNTSNRNETLFNRPQQQIDTSEIILHKVNSRKVHEHEYYTHIHEVDCSDYNVLQWWVPPFVGL